MGSFFKDLCIILKTFIRWQGNKSKYIKTIKNHIPEYKGKYIEPFVGSGALFLDLEPKKWIINDLNKDLINIWKYIKTNPDDIIKNFKEDGKNFKPMSFNDKKIYCKENIDKLNYIPYDCYRAYLFIFMKFCSYRGDILKNNKFIFNGLDFNIYKKNTYSFLNDKYFNRLKNISEYINNSKGKIYNKSYKEVLKYAKKGDFVFLDPPYFEDISYQFNYNKDEKIDINFLHELKNEVDKLTSKGIFWIMTNADTKEVKKVFNEYKINEFNVYRQSTNSYKNELIIMPH